MTNAPTAQPWLPQAGAAPQQQPGGAPLPWLPTAGYFYADIADEDGPTAAVKAMTEDADEFWDEWEEKAELLYQQLVPTWWKDKRSRLDYFYKKTQDVADPMTGMTAWQLQALFYPDDFREDQADYLELREEEAAGKL